MKTYIIRRRWRAEVCSAANRRARARSADTTPCARYANCFVGGRNTVATGSRAIAVAAAAAAMPFSFLFRAPPRAAAVARALAPPRAPRAAAPAHVVVARARKGAAATEILLLPPHARRLRAAATMREYGAMKTPLKRRRATDARKRRVRARVETPPSRRLGKDEDDYRLSTTELYANIRRRGEIGVVGR